MISYPLTRLLRLREHRLAAAQAEIARQRRLLAEAEALAEEAEARARDFAARRPLEEAALFARIREKILEQKDLERYHAAIAALAARETDLFDLARQAKAGVERARADLDQALDRHKTALMDVNKFEKHRAAWREEESKRREAVQELDIEEAAAVPGRAR
jgi:hypothetical protein